MAQVATIKDFNPKISAHDVSYLHDRCAAMERWIEVLAFLVVYDHVYAAKSMQRCRERISSPDSKCFRLWCGSWLPTMQPARAQRRCQELARQG